MTKADTYTTICVEATTCPHCHKQIKMSFDVTLAKAGRTQLEALRETGIHSPNQHCCPRTGILYLPLRYGWEVVLGDPNDEDEDGIMWSIQHPDGQTLNCSPKGEEGCKEMFRVFPCDLDDDDAVRHCVDAIVDEAVLVLYDRLPHVVAHAAEQEFWRVIADAYPEAESGDLPPAVSAHLSGTMQQAVRTWVNANVKGGGK